MDDSAMPGEKAVVARIRGKRDRAAAPKPVKISRRERKRKALVRAAVGTFNKQGIHQTSLDQIGETLGLTRAALYYYYPSKSALLAACFARAMELTRLCLEEAKRSGTSGREKLIIFFRRYIETTHEELDGYFLLTEDYTLDPKRRAELIRDRDVVEKQLRALVRLGIRDGSVVDCDPKLAVFLLLGAVNWIPKWFSADGEWSYRQLAQAATEMLDRMLSTKPPPRLAPKVGKASPGAPKRATRSAAKTGGRTKPGHQGPR